MLPFPAPRALLMFAVSAAAVLFSHSARANIVTVDQARSIVAEASHRVTDPEVVDTKTAPNSSRFNDEALAHVADPGPGGEFSTSRVTQFSDVLGGVSAQSGFDFTVGGQFARGHSFLTVTYDVTDFSYVYDLNYFLGPVNSQLGVRGAAFNAKIDFRRLDGPGGETPIIEPVDVDLADQGNEPLPNQATNSLTGTIVPGRYRFTFDVRGFSIDFNHNYGANFRTDLRFQQVVPNPVPLPPAAWAGLFATALLGAVQAIRSRVRA